MPWKYKTDFNKLNKEQNLISDVPHKPIVFSIVCVLGLVLAFLSLILGTLFGYGDLFLFLSLIYVFLFFHGSIDYDNAKSKWYFVGPVKKIYEDFQYLRKWYSRKKYNEVKSYLFWGLKFFLLSFLWSKKVRQEIFAHKKVLFSLTVGVFLFSITSLSYWDHEGHFLAKFLEVFLSNLFYILAVYISGIIPILAVIFIIPVNENNKKLIRLASIIPIFFLVFNWSLFQIFSSVPSEDAWCGSHSSISKPKDCNHWVPSSLGDGQKIVMNEEAFPKRLTFRKAPTMFFLCGSNAYVFNYNDDRVFFTSKTKVKINDFEEYLDFSLYPNKKQIVLQASQASELSRKLLKAASLEITFNIDSENSKTWTYRTGFINKYIGEDLSCFF